MNRPSLLICGLAVESKLELTSAAVWALRSYRNKLPMLVLEIAVIATWDPFLLKTAAVHWYDSAKKLERGLVQNSMSVSKSRTKTSTGNEADPEAKVELRKAT